MMFLTTIICSPNVLYYIALYGIAGIDILVPVADSPPWVWRICQVGEGGGGGVKGPGKASPSNAPSRENKRGVENGDFLHIFCHLLHHCRLKRLAASFQRDIQQYNSEQIHYKEDHHLFVKHPVVVVI